MSYTAGDENARGGMADIAAQVDFHALLASSPNPYVLLDTNLRLVWMNDAYLRITDRNRDEILGRTMFDAFPSPRESESYRSLNRSLKKVLETGKRDEIALLRYDIPKSDGTMERRYWSATHTPVPGTDGSTVFILQHTVDVTELHGLRTLRDEMSLMHRAQAIQSRNEDLAEEAAQLKGLFEQAPGFVAILQGRDHRFMLANRAYRDIVEEHDLIGKSLEEALPTVAAQGFTELLNSVLDSGEPYVATRRKIRLGQTASNPGRDHYLDFIYQPIFDSQAKAVGVLVQGHDVTEKVEAEERQTLMINELNHRVKNTLSIVQGLAMQSFRQIAGSEEARRTFDARLHALSAAHSMLTARNWKESQLHETVRTAVAATAGVDADRFEISGEDITLRPQTAVALAMSMHELSTNAIKYGAISGPSGKVTIRWTVEPFGTSCRVTIDWVETGGPLVTPPTRRGFGTRLIERGISSEPGAEVEMAFPPEGMRCRIVAPLRDTNCA